MPGPLASLSASVFRVSSYPRDVLNLPQPTRACFIPRALMRFSLQRFEASVKISPFSRMGLPPMPFSPPARGCSFEQRDWCRGSGGLIPSRSLFSSPRLLTRLRENGRSCDLALAEVGQQPRSSLSNFHPLVRFVMNPLQEPSRRSRVLTCCQRMPAVFHKQSAWPLQPCDRASPRNRWVPPNVWFSPDERVRVTTPLVIG